MDGDFHTLAFLNSEGDFDSKPVELVIKYYDENGNALGGATLQNTDTYGGWNPTVSSGMLDRHRILYIWLRSRKSRGIYPSTKLTQAL